MPEMIAVRGPAEMDGSMDGSMAGIGWFGKIFTGNPWGHGFSP